MNSSIQEALSIGKWGEIVSIEQEKQNDDDAQTSAETNQTISLTPCLDQQHGGFVWNPIHQDEHAVTHFLQTKAWIFPMLNDAVRNRLYQQALELAVQHVQRKKQMDAETNQDSTKEPITVWDIGCGTGLWGMVAANCLQSSCSKETPSTEGTPDQSKHPTNKGATTRFKVLSMDMSNFMVKLANQIVQDNYLTDVVQVKEVHSSQHSNEITDDVNGHVSICVSELLDHGLLGEGWLPSLREFWSQQKRLFPGNSEASSTSNSESVRDPTQQLPIVIPAGATVYAQAVECCYEDGNVPDNIRKTRALSWFDEYKYPRAYHSAKHGFQMDFVQSGGSGSKGLGLPIHADTLIQKKRLKILSDPCPISTINVEKPESVPFPGQQPNVTNIPLRMTQSGRVDAILVSWKLHMLPQSILDSENTPQLSYSLQSGDGDNFNWQDHWCPCLHDVGDPVHFSHEDGKSNVQTFKLSSWHDDQQIHVQLTVDNSAEIDERPSKRLHVEQTDRTQVTPTSLLTQVSSPLRIRQLCSRERLQTLERGLDEVMDMALSQRPSPGERFLVLDVSDFCLCGLIAAHLLTTKQNKIATNIVDIYSMESSFNDKISLVSAEAAQANSVSGIQFQVLQCHSEALSRRVFWPNEVSPSTKTQDEATAVESSLPPSQYVDALVAEPYFAMTETWPLISAMNFYNLVQRLRRVGVVGPHTKILPAAGRIMVCAISSPQLFASYRPVGDSSGKVVGLDHSHLNSQRIGKDNSATMQETASDDLLRGINLTLPLWEYTCDRIGPAVQIATLNYQENDSEPELQASINIPIEAAKQMHGLLVWVNYDLAGRDGSNASTDEAVVLSTDCEFEHQLVHLFERPLECTGTQVVCRINLNGCSGNQQEGITVPLSFEIYAKSSTY